MRASSAPASPTRRRRPAASALTLPAGRVAAPPFASSRKQLTAPVWQAGPAGSTVMSTVSWSQSRRRETTRWTLPLVPPLCQSSRRLRLQNVDSPEASVARSASSLA